jgi:ABC-type glycerol-3-phosphate transport system substrate-binding protein
MRARKCIAAALALTLTAAAAGCGSSSGSSSKKDDSSFVETVTVASSDDIDRIKEGVTTEIEWFSYFDINPTRGWPEKRTDLALFEQSGGTIKYTRTG